MANMHWVLIHGFSPFLLLILLSGYLHFNKHGSCLALRYMDERDNFDWEALVDKEAAKKRLIDIYKHSNAHKKELDYLLSLDRATRKPTTSDDEADSVIDNLSQRNEQNTLEGPWIKDTAPSRIERLQLDIGSDDTERSRRRNDVLFIVIIATSSLIGIIGLIAAAIFWYRIHKKAEAALDAEYPSYGVTGPGSAGNRNVPSSAMSDRKLAQSAQMFHYQQQRQQMMAQEKTHFDAKPADSDDSDDETVGGGDYTVYECPGLAPTGEMEVRNPLFAEPDSTLPSSATASQPTTDNQYPQAVTSVSSSSPPKENNLS